ncbi:protein-export chaperone SecB [Pseudobacteriovorax antillogorgiicola]|uniref:Protein translocase subunit secB n=1 Tax=Pseudobacteriovorax antillogorgiicola TaxID=1513793 RepID=A0A1Y6CHX8_9BACT|nr:protein-export chaperone SecB [Pseudobacteriovorax antillogorgiicola]TCS47028.1 protein translocase subunit secB [Pseudobacteriovorax antillogorgiicola]SMF65268.1 protein translocase subunit secB [Pseudobacteriovorax antillogorgiicola]
MSNQNQVQVALQRIYLKDLSFESPDPVASFKTKWEPQVNLDIRNQNRKVEGDLYESVLELTATVKVGEQTAFIVEVEQAGIFMIKGLEGEQLNRVLGTFCMNVLFPYAREAVDSMCLKGSFPPLVLAPINFDALYDQSKNQNNK